MAHREVDQTRRVNSGDRGCARGNGRSPAAADPANKHTQTVTNSCGTVTFQVGTHNLINWFTLDSSVFVGLGFNFIVDGEIEASNPPPPGQAGRLESCDFIVVDEEGLSRISRSSAFARRGRDDARG